MLLDALNSYALLVDLPGGALVWTKLGCLARDAGEHPQARAYFNQQLHIERALGNRGGIGIALLNLACVEIRAGRWKKGSNLLRSVQRDANDLRIVAVAMACRVRSQGSRERARAASRGTRRGRPASAA